MCILLISQFQYAVSVRRTLLNCISYSDYLKGYRYYLLLSTQIASFGVRLRILQQMNLYAFGTAPISADFRNRLHPAMILREINRNHQNEPDIIDAKFSNHRGGKCTNSYRSQHKVYEILFHILRIKRIVISISHKKTSPVPSIISTCEEITVISTLPLGIKLIFTKAASDEKHTTCGAPDITLFPLVYMPSQSILTVAQPFENVFPTN